MLRLWRDRVLVSLSPSGVAWVRIGGGIMNTTSQTHKKQHALSTAAVSDVAWQAPVGVLREQASGWGNGAVDVHVVLSNHFVRYALIPATDGIGNDAEALGIARFHFGKVHGSKVQAWDVRLTPAPRGATRLAAAIDSQLLHALRECFPAKGPARLKSLQPWLMSAYNAARKAVPATGAWLLLVEPERVCAALLTGKNWQAVQNIRGRFNEPGDCLHLLERERLRAGSESIPQTVLIQGAPDITRVLQATNGWKPLPLRLRWPAGMLENRDAAYALAITAL